jgi:hypothetical protein
MLTPDAIIGAMLVLRPLTPPLHVERISHAIYSASTDENDAAALVVTAIRESDAHIGCIEGIGGRGTFGLGFGYMWAACGPLKIQAQTALQALHDKGAPYNWRGAFRGYLGARSDHWPEIRIRYVLWLETADRIRCACSL